MTRFLILILIFIQSTFAFALAPKWTIIPAESTLNFTATQNNAPVSGKFTVFNGDIQFDPQDLAHSQIKIIVDLNSVTTSYQEVGDTLKSSEWFHVKVFPNAVFDASQFKKIGNNTFEAKGQLTLRDKSLPVTLTFTLDDYSESKARATGQTIIQRNNFGVGQGEWSSTNEVKNDVKIDFTISAIKK